MSSRPEDEETGTAAGTPLSFSRHDLGEIARRIWLLWGFHNLSLLAGGVAFFCFLAITPLIASIVLIYGLVADVATVQQQVGALTRVIPSDAASVIEGQLLQVVTTSATATGIGLVVALALAIYGGTYAANGLIAALNVINSELETRGLVTLTRRAFGLTMAAILVGLTGLISGGLFAWLTSLATPVFAQSIDLVLKGIAWVAALTLGTGGFALIMRYGPDRRAAKWRWLTPGAIVATLLWMAASFGLSLYVAYVSNYSATYGSLSAVVVFLMWLYLSAYGLLLGALVNAELERQTAADSTRGADRPVGSRGAVLADTVVTLGMTETYLQKRKRKHEDRLAHAARRATRGRNAQDGAS
jgi:membrane protein